MEFTLSNAIQIVLVLGSAGATIVTLRVTVKFLKSEFAELKQATRSDISGIQTEIKQIGQILIRLADIRGEMKVIDTRVNAIEQDIRELRHGDGFVRGRRNSIDGEYPPIP
jgi:hypothetical protein